MMKFANEKKKAWLILLIDFNKAFDSIDHKFLENTLKILGRSLPASTQVT